MGCPASAGRGPHPAHAVRMVANRAGWVPADPLGPSVREACPLDVESDRRHPHRLSAEEYRVPDEVVFATWCSRWHLALTEERVVHLVVHAMGRAAVGQGVHMHAYCIMPEHVHAVASVREPAGDIAAWVRFAKREAAAALSAPGMWQRSYWDRHARADEDVVAMVQYTLDNPVRRGLRAHWTEWPYSWSEWHVESQGPDPNHIPRRRSR